MSILYSVCASINGSIQPAPYISWCQTRTRSVRSGGEQTNHETSAPPLGTVLPVKMLLRLVLIVIMFNKPCLGIVTVIGIVQLLYTMFRYSYHV